MSTNDTYYWSVSGNRNWTEAEGQCAAEGGHLVEIFNEDTQNIIVSLIATEEEYLDELYWIGIGEHVDSSAQWRSGNGICYSNLSRHINSTQSRCAAVNKLGSWLITSCAGRHSHICERSK